MESPDAESVLELIVQGVGRFQSERFQGFKVSQVSQVKFKGKVNNNYKVNSKTNGKVKVKGKVKGPTSAKGRQI